MKMLMIACSQNAYRLMQDVKSRWIEKDSDTTIICKVKCSSLPEISMSQSVLECVEEWFDRVNAIVFFTAVGIAVRSIAPCLKHKSTDPAVVVVDETGKFSISLLSGHAGGANELAQKIADMTGAVPVITTATDREDRFAVDDYARKHDLAVTDWKLAKEISAAVLEGEPIGFRVDSAFLKEKDFEEGLSEQVHFYRGEEAVQEKRGIQVCYAQAFQPAFSAALQLVPRVFVIGIGCKKNTGEERIAGAVKQCLEDNNIRFEAVYAVASIDIKRQERGITEFCKNKKLPFLTYSASELQSLEGEYSCSSFVEQVTGVSNVCERSAMAAAGGRLICGKRVYDGVTVAIAQRGSKAAEATE